MLQIEEIDRAWPIGKDAKNLTCDLSMQVISGYLGTHILLRLNGA